MKSASPEQIPLLALAHESSKHSGMLATMAAVNRERYMISRAKNGDEIRQSLSGSQKSMSQKLHTLEEFHAAPNKMKELVMLFFFVTLFIPITYWYADVLIGKVVGWEDSEGFLGLKYRVSKGKKKELRHNW